MSGGQDMRICIIGLAVILTVISMSVMAQEKIGGDDIVFTPIEHATMVIQTKKATIYVDPVGDVKRFASFPKSDIILITHIHHDHLDPSTIASLKNKDTVVVGPKTVIDELKYGKILKNGEKTTVKGVQVEAIPAYNITPGRMNFHPKGRDNGYVLELKKKRIYISGDTGDTQEMRGLKNIDFAFVSVNLPYTMTVEQAASAVLEIKPKAVYPYHYRGRKGMSDLKKFQLLVEKDKDIEVRLLDWYR
jgi:L-ascorbate metabolism protein UlaG (beta-lactamase superfamily)